MGHTNDQWEGSLCPSNMLSGAFSVSLLAIGRVTRIGELLNKKKKKKKKKNKKHRKLGEKVTHNVTVQTQLWLTLPSSSALRTHTHGFISYLSS